MSSRHHADLVLCRRLPSSQAQGRLCAACEGRCVLCDSYVRPAAPVRLCSQCNYGAAASRCVLCDRPGATNDAFYCRECVQLEKDRDGCPKAVNVGAAKLDLWYQRQRNRPSEDLLSLANRTK